MERRVGVSPVTVMVALLIGGALWGLLGAILAIPTAAILSVIVDRFATRTTTVRDSAHQVSTARRSRTRARAEPQRIRPLCERRDTLVAVLLYAVLTIAADLAARARPHARPPGRLRRSAVHIVGAGVGRHAPAAAAGGTRTSLHRIRWRSPTRSTFCRRRCRSLPVYAATQNPILCYNLLFLSTFVLSGLGMFLLGARADRQRARPAFVAGARVRVRAVSHRVASRTCRCCRRRGCRSCCSASAATSRRGRLRPLAGAAAAWIAQNLSCGYYLLFFSAGRRPLHRVGADARAPVARPRGRCRASAVAVAAVAGGDRAVPAAVSRAAAARLQPAIAARETMRFSADVYAYLTADPNLRLWGRASQRVAEARRALFPGTDHRRARRVGRASAPGAGRASSPAWFDHAWPSRSLAASCVVIDARCSAVRSGCRGLKITSLARAALAAAALGDDRARWLRARSAQRRRALAPASPAGIFAAITAVRRRHVVRAARSRAKGRVVA